MFFTNVVAGGALEFRVTWNNVASAPTLTLSDVTIDGTHNWVAANLAHDVGRLDAHQGWSAHPVRDTNSGYLTSGPGTAELPTGAWRADFELKVDDFDYDNSTIATLSVVDVDANRVVASRDLRRSEFPNARYGGFELYFQAVADTRYDLAVLELLKHCAEIDAAQRRRARRQRPRFYTACLNVRELQPGHGR